MVKSRLARAICCIALPLLASSAMAQDADDAPPPSSDALNLPSDMTIFGTNDPTLHKATAIVNGAIVTDTDVDSRLQLVLLANGGKIEDAERDRLKLQVLRNLIDETLQIQEAKAHDIVVSDDEIEQTFNRVSSNFKRKPADFAAFLSQNGTSAASIKRQIEGELAWRRLLSRQVEPFINVGDDEVKAVIDRLNASKGAKEYRVGEIFLSATPESSAAVSANAAQIVDQIRKGASFVAYARQYSEASTAAVGGDLGWVRAEQLPDPLTAALRTLEIGQISAPIAVPGGYSIVAMLDQRQVLTADPRDAVLSLKQISLNFPTGAIQSQVAPKIEALAAATRSMAGCGAAESVAAGVKAEVVENDQVRVRDLPPAVQQMLLKLSIGQSTPPFGSLTEGVRVLVLCGRDDPQVTGGPSFDQIYAQMEEERVNRRAQRYLRDLRRDAVVDYR